MFDKAMALMFFPFIICVLLVGWLVYATMRGRAIKLSISGLGLAVTIDTTPPAQVNETLGRELDIQETR